MPTSPAYAQDFYAWTQEQAALLEARRFDALDIENLVEEITALGISQRHALGSHLRNLLLHLLKWHYQPGGRETGHSWLSSIISARREIESVLDYSPSLQRDVHGFVLTQYPKARRDAQQETRLPAVAFPDVCPWTVEQVLDLEFLPGESCHTGPCR